MCVVRALVPLSRFEVEDEKYARIAMRRLGCLRGRAGFGNARAVRNFYEKTLKRQADRIVKERQAGGSPELLLLVRDDLLGPKCIDVSSSAALKELYNLEVIAQLYQLNDVPGFALREHTM
jgi:AAA lid domain